MRTLTGLDQYVDSVFRASGALRECQATADLDDPRFPKLEEVPERVKASVKCALLCLDAVSDWVSECLADQNKPATGKRSRREKKK